MPPNQQRIDAHNKIEHIARQLCNISLQKTIEMNTEYAPMRVRIPNAALILIIDENWEMYTGAAESMISIASE